MASHGSLPGAALQSGDVYLITGANIGGDSGNGFALKTKSDFGNGLTVRARAAYEHYEYEPTPEAFIGFNRRVRTPQSALAAAPQQGLLCGSAFTPAAAGYRPAGVK